MKLINADKVIEKLKEHKSLFCKNRDEFRALSDKDKARVDEIDTCIAELVNAEEVQTTDTDTDTISRQAAIEALEKVARFFPYKIHGKPETYDRYNEAWNDAIGRAELEINELPPVQPKPSQVAKDIARIVENGQDMRVIGQERIRGHWIIRETSSGDTEARCSHCGFTALVDEPGNGLHMVSDLNFCPNCGADMRQREETNV